MSRGLPRTGVLRGSPTYVTLHTQVTPALQKLLLSVGVLVLTRVAQSPVWERKGELSSGSHTTRCPGSPSIPCCRNESFDHIHLT